MLGSITPLGERGRQRRWGITVSAYMIGSVIASTGLGAGVGTLGQTFVPSLDRQQRLLALAFLLALGTAADLRVFGWRLPTHRRQVNEAWMNQYRGWAYGFGYGFQLGLALVTVVNTSAIYLMIFAALLAGSTISGAIVIGSFGLLRALILLRTRSVNRSRDLQVLHEAIERSQSLSTRISVAAQSVIALTLAVGAIGFLS